MIHVWRRVYVMAAVDAFSRGSMTNGVTIAIIHTQGYEVFRNAESIFLGHTLDEAYDFVEKLLKE